jgi:hypothetical protein
MHFIVMNHDDSSCSETTTYWNHYVLCCCWQKYMWWTNTGSCFCICAHAFINLYGYLHKYFLCVCFL